MSSATALVNLSQTATVAYPVLGGRYGFGKAAGALIAASKETVKGHNDMNGVLTGDKLQAYHQDRPGRRVDGHGLAGVAAGNDTMLHGAVGIAMKGASFMLHHAERFKRQASYRLARQTGMDHEAAYTASVNGRKGPQIGGDCEANEFGGTPLAHSKPVRLCLSPDVLQPT